jgi:hypothetical protein
VRQAPDRANRAADDRLTGAHYQNLHQRGFADMSQRVYRETSLISDLAARPSRDLIVAPQRAQGVADCLQTAFPLDHKPCPERKNDRRPADLDWCANAGDIPPPGAG